MKSTGKLSIEPGVDFGQNDSLSSVFCSQTENFTLDSEKHRKNRKIFTLVEVITRPSIPVTVEVEL
jgi:hypothetical protein